MRGCLAQSWVLFLYIMGGIPMKLRLWKHRPIRHVFVWLGSWIAFYLAVRFQEGHAAAVSLTTPMMLAGPLPVYAHFAALQRYFEKRKYIPYCVWLGVIVAVSAFWAQFIFGLIERNPDSHTNGLGIAVFFIMFSTGFRYFSHGMSRQYRLQEAESKQRQTEIALLRSQINPHFLFNTLNNLYALSLDQSTRVPEVILKLSELMRYVLDSSHRKTVHLGEEVRFIESYVELERLRLDRNDEIRLQVIGEPGSRFIAPMLMLPFVENGFKHGVTDAQKGGYIHIGIEMARDRILFSIENRSSGSGGAGDGSVGGMGLENVKQRLALLYPGRHHLSVADGEDTHRVEMSLWL